MSPLRPAAVLAVILSAIVPALAQVSWRPGFSPCVTSLNPSEANYFSVLSGCATSWPHQSHWLVGVQSEATLGQSCTGSNAHALPINVGGPLTLVYEPFQGAWSLRLRTDFIDHPHPCPGETWTWFSVMDHLSSGGGPLPPTSDLTLYLRGRYHEVTGTTPTRLGPVGGITRMGVLWQGFWGGKSLLVDVQLYTHPLWGDAHPDPDVIYRIETSAYTYVATQAAYSMPLNAETGVTVPVSALVADLIARGLLPAPVDGEPQTTVAVGVFTEVHTLTSEGNSAAADLVITEFRAL